MPVDAKEIANLLSGLRSDLPPPDLEQPFFDQGYDSLDVSGLYLEVEKRWHFVIEEADMEKLVNVRSLADYVNRHKAAPDAQTEHPVR